MNFLFLILFYFVAISQCMIIKYKKCTSPASSGVIGDVIITPCDSLPCSFKRGGSGNIKINFQATKNNSELNSVVKGKIGPLWVPFPLSQPNACQNEGITCPIKAGQSYLFSYDLPISTTYPAISVVVSWEIQDENGNDVVCIQLPIKLE
ncbi:NPC intracellular cholesterol transporter 2 homolog a [Hydra vulgaris]|uniref:NPC intracellular cholesterol transporter 2 homolog a n=1 Tax=Hydra vulgaris TaxID=6087 RepID=A0ABM4B7M1_HYDVU